MSKNKLNGTTLDDLAGMMLEESKRVDDRFDDLANMVAKGFENTVTKGEMKELRQDVNKRFHSIDQRLGKVEYHVDEVHDILKRFEENDILNIQKRVQILEKVVRSLANQIQK